VNINMGVNNSGEKFYKNTAIFNKLIIAVYASVIYISCTCLSSWLEYNSLFVGLGGWGVRVSEQKLWLIKWMDSMFRV
jgi:hypothetical protein